MNIWYTSDLHLMHDHVAHTRGFNSTARHDHVICTNWANTVQPEDEVYILGDITLKNPRRVVDTINELPGHKHLIAGNHDQCHPMHRRWRNKLPVYHDMFNTITAYDSRKTAGHNVLLSHFPYTADHTDEIRHPEYRLPNVGHWLLHGHTHTSKVLAAGPWQIHIGLDAWNLHPVNTETIANIINP